MFFSKNAPHSNIRKSVGNPRVVNATRASGTFRGSTTSTSTSTSSTSDIDIDIRGSTAFKIGVAVLLLIVVSIGYCCLKCCGLFVKGDKKKEAEVSLENGEAPKEVVYMSTGK
jgi:hypothetical protein